ncbi:MAG: TetR/AcrR family transcriptional regulator, partial [Acidimicrobiales bacterium]
MRVAVSILCSNLLMASHTPPHSAPQPIDGRRARSQRGRLATLEAMIDLINEGHAPPTAQQVAQRAGISVATLFRYFETLEDLRQYATQQCLERFAHLF